MKTISSLMPNYRRLPIEFDKGHGCWLQDNTSMPFLDANAGLGVINLGYNHPDIQRSMLKQAKKLFHVSNQYYIRQQEELAETLCQLSGLDSAYFCNSGSEANEVAIKLARLHARKQKIMNPIILTMRFGCHGSTMANVSQAFHDVNSYQFAPLLPGFVSVTYNDPQSLKHALIHHPNVVAVILEPIQGEAGVIIPDDNYLKEVRRICDQFNVLMVLDEVLTGCGRTGKFFAFEHLDIQPDIVTLAKGLGNGLPIGACLASKEVGELLTSGMHNSTFGGNPLCCAVALKVCQIIRQQKFLNHVIDTGHYLLAKLKQKLAQTTGITQIRGKGLLIAIECQFDCSLLPEIALDHHLLIHIVHKRIIQLTPALVITQDLCDHLVDILVTTIHKHQKQHHIHQLHPLMAVS